MIIPQSVKILLAKATATTDVNGIADAVVKIPSEGRTLEGGFGFLVNQESGDYMTADIMDDDNIYGFGAGATIATFDDQLVDAVNQGWYFIGSLPLQISPLVSDNPTDLPPGLYLHICAHKANIATADTFYVNIHWGNRIR